jgi:predicted nucleic acid-binding Zn ribbon protein
MSIRVTCHNCQRPLEAPANTDLKFISCPKCGSYTSLPGTEPTAEYGYAEPFKKCPHCGKELPRKAVLCVRCGYSYESGQRVRRRTSLRPFYRHWGGYILVRLGITIGLLAFAAPVVFVARPAVAVSILGGWAAFLLVSLGSFPTATLRRERSGRCFLKTRQWVCYIPLPQQTIHLDPTFTKIEPDLLGRDLFSATNVLEPDGLAWWWALQLRLMGLVLAFSLALAFGRYVLTLAEDHGSHMKRTTIYRGRLESSLREMAETLCEEAGLSYS